LSYSIEPNIPVKVIGEKESVREILLQLLSNAVAFTKRGEIRVKVSRADAADVAYTSDDQTTPSDEVTLTFVVSDTGKGMSPEKRRSICNLLFSPAAALPLDHKDLPYVSCVCVCRVMCVCCVCVCCVACVLCCVVCLG
jgi:signal transduction histidine kinase